jgi:hypothetical protein
VTLLTGFTQLFAAKQIIAVVPDAIALLKPGVAAPACAKASTAKPSPAKPDPAQQFTHLVAQFAAALPVEPSQPVRLSEPRSRTCDRTPVHAEPAKPPVCAVEVSLPAPVAQKLQIPALTDQPKDTGGPKPLLPPAANQAETPPPVIPQPQAILDVAIHDIAAHVDVATHIERPQPTLPLRANVAPTKPDPAGPLAIAPKPLPTAAAEFTKRQNPEGGKQDPDTPHPHNPEFEIIQPRETAPAAPAEPAPPAAATPRESRPEPAASSTPQMEAAPPEQPKQQQHPMRSVSLEFTPDGAHDVRVRLSERAGDVHISLHSTDASLAGRVREGVGDLVGSLSSAGYDAEAWTPDHGGGRQRQPEEERKDRPNPHGNAAPGEFNGILEQPIQEVS